MHPMQEILVKVAVSMEPIIGKGENRRGRCEGIQSKNERWPKTETPWGGLRRMCRVIGGEERSDVCVITQESYELERSRLITRMTHCAVARRWEGREIP